MKKTEETIVRIQLKNASWAFQPLFSNDLSEKASGIFLKLFYQLL